MAKFLVFDLGETLLDFNLEGRWHDHLQWEVIPEMIMLVKSDTSSKHLKNISEEELRLLFYQKIAQPPNKLLSMVTRIEDILTYLSIKPISSLINRIISVFERSLQPYVKIYPDVVDSLKFLRKNSNILGLWSNTPWQSPGFVSRSLMEKFQIAKYFDYMYFSGDFEVRKPNPKTMEIVLEQSGQKKEEMAYIGNSELDIITGVNFNIPTVWINRNSEQLSPSCPTPTIEINSLTELPKVISLLH
ncbi:MAG: HAD family hydrolase [Promethearchaeota archaeon]